MKIAALKFLETGSFSALVNAYLSEPERFSSFTAHPFSEDGVLQAAENRKGFSQAQRQILVEAITEQYAHVDMQQLQEGQLARLLDADTYTVTTAHQPNLFGGPAYFVYKIASAIALANRMNKKGMGYFVPVYWMGAEDHDEQELNHTWVFGQKLDWKTDQKGAVGRMQLGDLQPIIDELSDILGDSEHGQALQTLIKDCYRLEYTVAQATRVLVDTLFGKHGLVVVDGDHPALKSSFIPVMEDELLNQTSLGLVSASAAKLESLGFKAQIHPREINLFYLDAGIRERIIAAQDGFATADGQLHWSKEEILALLHSSPEKFSPNVVLRALYQEQVLPNTAFIGGGAEVAYWFLLRDLFAKHQVHFPPILLRSSVLVIDQASHNRMEKLSIDIPQLFMDTEGIISAFIEAHESGVFALYDWFDLQQSLYEQAAERISMVDPSLKGAVLAEGKKAEGAMRGMEARAKKAQKQKHEIELNQIRALKAKLFPDNHLQERRDSFMNFYLTQGPDFIECCVKELDPLRQRFIVMH